ncbi:MAG: 4Fe-4S binding protein [Finegoldia sp.]|nr:4Fe-4S binding protein [Finegoldia sp.]
MENLKRHSIQAFYTLLTNSYFKGFFSGEIYQGQLKSYCVPGLNCYSCPGARFACPIGSLQAVIGARNFKFSFYVIGFLALIGGLIGRFVCGFLCPFGFFQDLIHKIPFPKKIRTFKFDKILRFLKYIVLLVFVILMPLFLVDVLGQGAPYFCKLICPAGTFEAGIPLVLKNEGLRATVGFLYAWKMVILVITLLVAIMIYRPFCKYLCPLGAIYSLFNPISLYRYSVNEHKCISCGKCKKVCKMNVDPTINPNDGECIRCGLCKNACPTSAIESGFIQKEAEEDLAVSRGI